MWGENMENYEEVFNKSFYHTLETAIAALPAETRAELYKPCAAACVSYYVLPEMQRQFAECGNSLDLQYEKYGRTEYFFADIIERGHVYELGYPRCLCPMVAKGLASAPTHCECSRQSVLQVLHTLLPDKKISVERLHTVLTGAKECRFRVTVEE